MFWDIISRIWFSQTLRLYLVPEKLKGKENAKENNFFMFGYTAEKKSNIIKIS